MGKRKNRPRHLLCPELDALARKALSAGNTFSQPPACHDWPERNAVFAALEKDLPPQVKHSINTDPHYGWHDECFCTVHKDLLTAGSVKRPSENGFQTA